MDGPKNATSCHQIGVDTQNEVVKKKKDCVMTTVLMDNPEVKKNVHKTSLSLDDYRFNGSFRRRKIREFKDFNKKFYVPNNAVLRRGDFNAAQTKEWIKKLWCDKKDYVKRNFVENQLPKLSKQNLRIQTFKSQWL
jgi:DUF4097 and DUF4098 domain-containing protein YvlB